MLKLSPIFAAALLFAPAANAEITSTYNPLDDSTRHLLVIMSDNQVENSIGIPKYVGLGVRCDKSSNFLMVTPTYNGSTFNSDHSTLRVRWDNEPVRSVRWSDSSNGKGFFSTSPLTDLAKAAKSDRVVIGWHPYQQTEKFATFNLKGYRSDLNKMLQLCK